MDYQHQHHQEYEYQQRQHSYNPYQNQIYDPSQPYEMIYSFDHQHQHQYPYYPPHPNSQTHLQYDSVHPPGVPLPQPNRIVPQQPFSDPGLASGFDPPPAPVIEQSPYRGGKSGKPSRGGRGRFGHHTPGPNGPAHSSFRGHGHGHGLGRHSGLPGSTFPNPSSSRAPPKVEAGFLPQPQSQPLSVAFCELCGVGCNSQEILEQHKNGKKHRKMLQKLDNAEQQNHPQMPGPVSGNTTSTAAEVMTSGDNNNTEQERGAAVVDNPETSVEELERTHGARFPATRGRGDKRKTRGGGRGGKYRKGIGLSRVLPAEPPKQLKQAVVPLVCELCNAKCDTQAVFDAHLVGKKHQSNLKRFHSSRGLSHPPTAAPVAANDPQLVLAQLLMTYVVSQAQAPGSSSSNVGAQNQPDPIQNALAEEIRSQLQNLIGMCSGTAVALDASNRTVNETLEAAATSGHVSLDNAFVGPGESSGLREQLPGQPVEEPTQ